MKNLIISNTDENVYAFIRLYIDLIQLRSLVLKTGEVFNIEKEPDQSCLNIINLKRLNDIVDLSIFFETINQKLSDKGFFVGCLETNILRKQRLLHKYPPVLSYIYLLFDRTFKDNFPHFFLTRGLYKFVTAERNRYMTKAEAFGRVYACGFKIIAEQEINGNLYFVSQKVQQPQFDRQPHYGFIFKKRSLGKNGKEIDFYKFRTMYPYSEYLQEYIYQTTTLKKGSKFKNDFRITWFGKIIRRYWLDEIPMLVNFFKGDMKLVGVRPLSKQFLSVQPQELINLRLNNKPGLIPAIYAHNPVTLEDRIEAELIYLKKYEMNPFSTDINYFFKVIYSIIFKGVRSD